MDKQGELLEDAADTQVKITYPDGGLYHQAGWDIQVSVMKGNETRDYYLEVKTHTRRSVMKNTLSLSKEQIKAAAKNRERYLVLSVVYDNGRKEGESLSAFSDPMSQIGEGVFVGQQKRYLFFVENQQGVPQPFSEKADIMNSEAQES